MYRESSFIIRKQSGFLELGLIYVSLFFKPQLNRDFL